MVGQGGHGSSNFLYYSFTTEVFLKILLYHCLMYLRYCWFLHFHNFVGDPVQFKLGLSSEVYLTLHKKWSFPLRISPVNVVTFTGEIRNGEILNGKRHFFYSETFVAGCLYLVSFLAKMRRFSREIFGIFQKRFHSLIKKEITVN